MGTKSSDQLLVERVQQGDKAAFDILVGKYQHKIIKLVGRYVRDPDEALDVAQDAFIKAYRALASFRGDSAFYTWLYRIAINTAKNQLASNKRRAEDFFPRPAGSRPVRDAWAIARGRHPGGHRAFRGDTRDREPGDRSAARGPANGDRAAGNGGHELRGDRRRDGVSGGHGALAHFRAREAIDKRLKPLLDERA
jgi:RNA polymerase sigma-70 factor, ECF subfamily